MFLVLCKVDSALHVGVPQNGMMGNVALTQKTYNESEALHGESSLPHSLPQLYLLGETTSLLKGLYNLQ